MTTLRNSGLAASQGSNTLQPLEPLELDIDHWSLLACAHLWGLRGVSQMPQVVGSIAKLSGHDDSTLLQTGSKFIMPRTYTAWQSDFSQSDIYHTWIPWSWNVCPCLLTCHSYQLRAANQILGPALVASMICACLHRIRPLFNASQKFLQGQQLLWDQGSIKRSQQVTSSWVTDRSQKVLVEQLSLWIVLLCTT